jgi:membrane fusion protein (multidrug efflux system)
MRFFRRWSVFILLVGGLLVLLVPKWISSGQSNGGGAPRPGLQAPVVRVMEIQPSTLNDRLRLTATLLAEDSVNLRAETAGMVTGIYFEDGSSVEKGTLLVKIKDDELQAQRRAKLLDIELARIQANRQERLLRSESTTQEAFDEARIRLETMKADLALIDARIEKTEIRAPFDGLIGLRQVSIGTYLEPTTVVTSIQSIDPLKMDVAIPERFLPRVRVGMELKFRIEGFDREFAGIIKALDPRINDATRTLTARATIDNSDRMLLPGGFASVELALNLLEDAIMVPSTAILPDLERTTVFLVEDGKAVTREIKTGIRTRNSIQVTEGLEHGETLIIAGLQRLRNGIAVNILNDSE